MILERVKEATTPVYRPPLPQQESEGVHPAILTLMKLCWAEEPAERPSFNDVAETLKIINRGKSVLSFFPFCIRQNVLVHCSFKKEKQVRFDLLSAHGRSQGHLPTPGKVEKCYRVQKLSPKSV